ncbi:riboflavin synthase [uncultured Campylobacter sp.]|uniref:riboflavin synthase n=1 Tax=uncultured Campylobacter sp. TaxID=218934 RepID=UPI0026026CE6|nr:riboflavin synthase [uncultured Campylobacter sp.]
MFNGLIREIAKVKNYQNNTLSLYAKHKPELGDSIAVNGACLSVTRLFEGGFELELSLETRNNIAYKNLKDFVHIEPALRYADKIDGHLLQGHIDGIGRLSKIQKRENGVDFYITVPSNLMKFMAKKGSVAIDGVSLTINEVFDDSIRLTIIPISFKETLFKNYELGREVNIESDLIARYLDRIVNFKDKDSLCQRMPYIY